jgi:hypothetical protein
MDWWSRGLPYSKAGLPDGIGIFKPKTPIWVNFGGPWNGRGWYIIYGHFEYITAIWYLSGDLVYFGKVCEEKSGRPILKLPTLF